MIGTVSCPYHRPYLKWLCPLSLALLVCNRAGSLAGRLAGSLAFAAAALDSAFFQVCLIDGLNVFHKKFLRSMNNKLLDTIWAFIVFAGY